MLRIVSENFLNISHLSWIFSKQMFYGTNQLQIMNSFHTAIQNILLLFSHSNIQRITNKKFLFYFFQSAELKTRWIEQWGIKLGVLFIFSHQFFLPKVIHRKIGFLFILYVFRDVFILHLHDMADRNMNGKVGKLKILSLY